MTSENIKKLIEVEQKARSLVENARSEREALRKSAKRDADIIAVSIRKKQDEDLLVLQKDYEKKLEEETEKTKKYYDAKIKSLKERRECLDELVDRVVRLVEGDEEM